MNCRHCGSRLALQLIDLGTAPSSNAYLTADKLQAPEKWYPLRVSVCETCWLVQTQDFTEADELFNADYAYFSSFSTTWLSHAKQYVRDMVERFDLNTQSQVVEIASNDGYLLQYVRARNIPCFGIEPTASTAAAAREKGIETIESFFGCRLARNLIVERGQADLMIANNVLAHIPDINDFVAGFTVVLKPQGIATFEFPHLIRLIAENQFDTIYHEHFSYLSLTTVHSVLAANGLRVFDVQELSTHGGSLRVFAQRSETGSMMPRPAVQDMLHRERAIGVCNQSYYADFQQKAERVKDEFVHFLIEAKRAGKRIAAYGAAAKGNTLINFSGVRGDLIRYVADRNPAKQGKFLPGSRIPIVTESSIYTTKPDYVLILPWNIQSEITLQLENIYSWSGRFVVAVPELKIL